MSQPTDSPNPSEKNNAASENDPLSSLYKMSRTAGLGSQEYVAVNATAVTSLLVGSASVLALLFGTLLLIIPIVAAVLAIVAIVQIRRSAGTQSGVGIAILGLLIAILFVGAVGGKAALHAREVSAAQGDIIQLIDTAGRNVHDGNYDAAWGLFTDRFHNRVNKEAFSGTWTFLQSSPMYGKVKLIRWTGLLEVNTDQESGHIAEGQVIIVLDNGAEDRHIAYFRKEQGRWLIDDIQPFNWNAGMAAPQRPGAGQ